MIGCLFGFATLAGAEPDSEQRRQHDSHLHGQGEFSVATDGDQLQISFKAPAADLLGFEHAPRNEEEVRAVSALKSQLKDIDALFAFNDEARCALTDVTFQLPGFESEGSNDQAHNHEKESHHEHEGHGKSDHHDKAEADEDPHQGHGHAEVAQDDAHEQHHTDIAVTYALTCGAVQSLASLTVNLFDLYPRFSEIDAVYLLDDKQSAHTLRADNRVLRFR